VAVRRIAWPAAVVIAAVLLGGCSGSVRSIVSLGSAPADRAPIESHVHITTEHWAVRISDNTNVSHGCINLSADTARVYHDSAIYDDPVEVAGSSVPLSAADGDIYDWGHPLGAMADHVRQRRRTLTITRWARQPTGFSALPINSVVRPDRRKPTISAESVLSADHDRSAPRGRGQGLEAGVVVSVKGCHVSRPSV